MVLHSTWACWSAKCRNEDKKPHVELTRRYTLDNVPKRLAEMAMTAVVQWMDCEHPHPGFLSLPVLHHKEMVGLAVCYAGLLDEQNWLMVAGYLKARLLKPAADRY